MDELYLDNIDEFVNDHNKIVTYKWLSLTLGVHVNTAKKMLYHYLDHKRKESSAQLHATYLVSGKFVDNGQTSHKVSLVKEDQLEDVKSKMSLIVSVHVYSVQKALLKDSGPLYGVDYDAVKDNLKNCSKYSAIRCSSAVPRSSVELQQARQTQPTPAPEPEHKQSPPNGNAAPASKPSTKPQKGIMGMFANKSALKNQDSGKEVKSEQKEDAPAVDEPKSKPPAKANSMMNFFGSQAAKKADKTVKQEEAAPSSSSAEQPRPSSQPEETHATPAAAAAAVESPKDSRSKTKRMEDSGSEEEKMDKKKRRRIKKPEPDSSDEDVIPDSPQQMETREASPSPKKKVESISQSNGNCEMKTRKRRRVLKSRTFVDDEGCIVTEKGYESESYSEAEDDSQAPKHTPKDPFPAKRPGSSKQDEKKSQKKASANSNKGTKQASIMGFFQKK
ncbi:DNA polymerase delta subunit 3 isoform X2 [Etheostoma spectabile]|uniref:DNA polymerase delta subunit 3 isoform X2 n=1 Tax=Etheostoma spectabile TaxID=54343 RepID=UPI0013AF2A25|nr:DNA polymerase delta subunit 3-like isoform X2 [Etheostoma spectabile]XP_032388000.1 DNA polymerase delta subunit 3-like isoform X2 [Etheostoma spectabile]